MHRFYLPPEACQGPTLTLREREAHHAAQVLRLRAGERAVVLDGAGHEFLCEVTAVTRQAVALAVRQTQTLPRLPYELTLIQAVTKAKSMEMIVRKATELGAAGLVPILSERSVPHFPAAQAEEKVAKWQVVALEAIKQCGTTWLMRIEPPRTPQAFLAQPHRFDLVLLASLQPGSRHPRARLADYLAEHPRPPAKVAVWVGPEGDFTPAELAAIQAAGAFPISLGPLILRSETAALYCLAVLGYELQARP